MRVEELIKYLEEVNNKEVEVFGSKSKINTDNFDYTIDVKQVLEALKSYEFNFEEYKRREGFEAEEELEDIASYKEGNNTYNWNAPINNDFVYHWYELDDKVIITLAVNLYGDIRANYSPEIMLQFDCIDTFYEVLEDCYNIHCIEVEGKEYDIQAFIFNEGLRIEEVETMESYCLYEAGATEEEVIDFIKSQKVEE